MGQQAAKKNAEAIKAFSSSLFSLSVNPNFNLCFSSNRTSCDAAVSENQMPACFATAASKLGSKSKSRRSASWRVLELKTLIKSFSTIRCKQIRASSSASGVHRSTICIAACSSLALILSPCAIFDRTTYKARARSKYCRCSSSVSPRNFASCNDNRNDNSCGAIEKRLSIAPTKPRSAKSEFCVPSADECSRTALPNRL